MLHVFSVFHFINTSRHARSAVCHLSFFVQFLHAQIHVVISQPAAATTRGPRKLATLSLSRTLAEESAHGSLGVGRKSVEQLVGVEASGLHEFAGGVDDALRHVALQGFGLEGLGDVGEALGGLGVDGGVGSGVEVSMSGVVNEGLEGVWTYWSINSARKEYA
jgi:hypothetical protein